MEMNGNEINASEISKDEIVKAMKSMHSGKAAGYDRVSAEMLKAGRGIIASQLLPFQPMLGERPSTRRMVHGCNCAAVQGKRLTAELQKLSRDQSSQRRRQTLCKGVD